MAGKWKKEWEAAKKAFTKITGKKKPKSSIDGKANKKTGLASILGKCDKAFATFQDETSKPARKVDMKKKTQALQEFRFYSREFKIKSEVYWKDIQTEMTKAKSRDLMKELDVLRKQIRAIADTMIAHGKMMESGLKRESAKIATAKNLRANLEGALKRALLFLAKIRARPDPKFWNDNIMKATRDVYQQIGNVLALRKGGMAVPGVPAGNPPTSVNQMKVWRTGKPTFEEGQEDEMAAEAKKILKTCQEIAAWLKTG